MVNNNDCRRLLHFYMKLHFKVRRSGLSPMLSFLRVGCVISFYSEAFSPILYNKTNILKMKSLGSRDQLTFLL